MTHPDEAITVIVTASPIPSHPASHIIDCTVESVRLRLPKARLIVSYDGVPPERREQVEPAYREHLGRIRERVDRGEWGDCDLICHDEWVHQAAMVREAVHLAETPCVLAMEADTALVRSIDFQAIVDSIDADHLHCVRLAEGTSIHPQWLHLHPDADTITKHGPLRAIRTVQWSQRPHVARNEWYRWMLDQYATGWHGFVEEAFHGPVSEAWMRHGEAGWTRHRLAIYAQSGDPHDLQRHVHTNGAGA